VQTKLKEKINADLIHRERKTGQACLIQSIHIRTLIL